MRKRRQHILCARAGRKQRRGGLSIIEVLVSIGILVLGLLGVVALIPIAAQHLRRGIALDDATAIARSGLAEFQARGGNNIQKWLRSQPAPPGVPYQPVGGVMSNLWGVQTTTPLYPNGNPHDSFVASSWAFCIDPMMYESVIVQDGLNRDTAFFPYQGNGSPLDSNTVRGGQPSSQFGRMLRVTLNWNAVDWRNQLAATSLNVGLANSMCVSADDLLLSRPGDEQLSVTVSQDESPASQFDVSMNSWDDTASTPVKRNAEGKMSWFATMVPLPGSVADGTRYYTLSVAVCEQRDLVIDRMRVDLTSIGDQQQQYVESERTCGVRFVGGGLNGGEVQLVSYDTDLARGMKNLSRLREGNWILISGPGTGFGHIFYWYRIASIETDPQQIPLASPTQVVRNATLRGPDWPGVVYPAPLSNPALGAMAEGIIPSNVINVFEHTIELRGE